MQVVVTGGSGFVGTHVVRELLAAGHSCWNLDVRPPAEESPARFALVDLRDRAALQDWSRQIAEPVALVHLASKVDSTRTFEADIVDNVRIYLEPAFHLLEVLKDRLLSVCFISTLETYGFPRQLPIEETHSTNPFNIYGAGKLAVEDFLRISCPVPLTILRLSHVYGPGEMYRKAIPLFIRACLDGTPVTLVGEGDDQRDFVHVADVAQAVRLAVDTRRDGLYNVSGGEPVETRELLQRIVRLTGANPEVQRRPSTQAPLRYELSIERIGRELGYRPALSLDQGLRTEIDWMASQR